MTTKVDGDDLLRSVIGELEQEKTEEKTKKNYAASLESLYAKGKLKKDVDLKDKRQWMDSYRMFGKPSAWNKSFLKCADFSDSRLKREALARAKRKVMESKVTEDQYRDRQEAFRVQMRQKEQMKRMRETRALNMQKQQGKRKIGNSHRSRPAGRRVTVMF